MIDDSSLKSILEQSKTIAIVGAKDKEGQPVDGVGRYLIDAGYTIIPIHPNRQNVWGLTTYKYLAEVPVAIDIVDVFRAPEFCFEHAKQTLDLSIRPKLFWLQLGIINEEATDLVEKFGIATISDACIKVEHRRLFRN